MPGIAGLITRAPREQALPQLERMVAALNHEDFYETGVWFNELLGVYVGWTVRKNSFDDCMPLQNERQDLTVVFSGEEFSEPGTSQRLKGRGHRLSADGPSYLVHLYEDAPSFPAELNGRFHGLVADQNHRTATLFNDRFGMHRLYYHESKEAFYFAAEAKAILAVRPELKSIDPQGLGEFISCGCTLEGRSFFQGIRVLPGATKWLFRDGTLVKREAYFKPEEWENQERLQPEPYFRELRDVFSRNLPRYFETQEKVGMSLTGGLDTRMIMAWQNRKPGSLPCYTFGGMRRDCQDVIVARKVARVCEQPHQVLGVGQDFLARFASDAERTVYLTDGCADVSRAPDLYLNRKAREIAPVRMTGNYGGEILRSVRAFKPQEPLPGLFDSEVVSHIQQTSQTYANLLGLHPVSFAAFKQGPWHHYGILALEETQLSMRSPFLDNDFIRTVFRAPLSTLAANEVSQRLIAEGNTALLRIPTDRGRGGEQGRLQEAVSHGVLEFLFKAEYAYDMGMPQPVARVDHALSSFRLERLFLGRHKIFHFRIWYRDALAAYVREMLLDPRSLARPYINRKSAETLVQGHLKGTHNYTTEIHKLLTLEILHRVFLDSGAMSSPEGGTWQRKPKLALSSPQR
jgi:asparagine synthase (glutamine-hydrolysing)